METQRKSSSFCLGTLLVSLKSTASPFQIQFHLPENGTPETLKRREKIKKQPSATLPQAKKLTLSIILHDFTDYNMICKLFFFPHKSLRTGPTIICLQEIKKHDSKFKIISTASLFFDKITNKNIVCNFSSIPSLFMSLTAQHV